MSPGAAWRSPPQQAQRQDSNTVESNIHSARSDCSAISDGSSAATTASLIGNSPSARAPDPDPDSVSFPDN
jgi:hypothetical protein